MAQHLVMNSDHLRSLLLSTSQIVPGDEILLPAGTYQGPFRSTLLGEPGNLIKVRPLTALHKVVVDNPAPTIIPPIGVEWNAPPYGFKQDGGGYVSFENMEVKWSYTDRTPGGTLTDRYRPDGFEIRGVGCVVTGCHVHDSGNGITVWEQAPGSKAIGNVLYANGWQDGQQGGTGHAMYCQNQLNNDPQGHKFNIASHGYGWGFQAYGRQGNVSDIIFGFNTAINVGKHALAGVPKSQFYGAADGNNVPVDVAFIGCMSWMDDVDDGIAFQLIGTTKPNYVLSRVNFCWAHGGKTLIRGHGYTSWIVRNNKFSGRRRMVFAGPVPFSTPVGVAPPSFSGNEYFYNSAFGQLFSTSNGASYLTQEDWVAANGETFSTYTDGEPDTTNVRTDLAYTRDDVSYYHITVFNHAGDETTTAGASEVVTVPLEEGMSYELINALNPDAIDSVMDSGTIGPSETLEIDLTAVQSIKHPNGSAYPALDTYDDVRAYILVISPNPLNWVTTGAPEIPYSASLPRH
jgi:hypothetical protein